MSAVFKTGIEPRLDETGLQRDFLRFEFKYILDLALRDKIESSIANFMHPDPIVASKPDQKYVVRSLYFDDPYYSSYYDKIDGLIHRAKFRLRTYTNNPTENCSTYLEIKGRQGQMVFKKRVPMLPETDQFIRQAGSDITQKIIDYAEPGYVRDRFRFDYLRKSIKPVMAIDYQRRPYHTRYSQDFRLTFDDSLYGLYTDSLYSNDTNKRSLLRGYTVMEIKFRAHIPAWFHSIIKSYELQRVSVSKVCAGINAWNLVPRLD